MLDRVTLALGRVINRTAELVINWLRRRNPAYRAAFDRVFQAPLERFAQFLINLRRRNEHLAIAEERELPGEQEIAREIAESLSRFLRREYAGAIAERAGNTKTYGLVRARLEVPDLPPELRVGIFRESRTYDAWVRFAGPGPRVVDDIIDNGILSIGIKLMGVEGEKLLDDESATQDFTGISSPTFTTPNVMENIKLQRHLYRGTPILYFLNPFDNHLLDFIMQGIYSKAHGNPLELQYYSCVPYLFGEGRAIQYTVRPRVRSRTPVPRRPAPDYLREAMAATLDREEVIFDLFVQFQTDAHRMPIENASVIWPQKLSPYRHVATLTIPPQRFDSPAQLAFARNLSFNPWHAIPEHRPLGNQNRARRHVYRETARVRREMNRESHIEPTGDEKFEESPTHGAPSRGAPGTDRGSEPS
jgi:hypothetical protein